MALCFVPTYSQATCSSYTCLIKVRNSPRVTGKKNGRIGPLGYYHIFPVQSPYMLEYTAFLL